MARSIELHYWPTANGHKVAIALEEMGLAYEVRPVNILRGDQFRPEFLAISPNNRIPAIVDPEGFGAGAVSVFESGAILQHLGRKSGRFYDGDEGQRLEIDQWLFWQIGGLGPMAGQAHHFREYAPAMIKDQRQLAYSVDRYSNEVHRLYGVMDRRLDGRDFLADAYSIADIACWPWVLNWRRQGIHLPDFPRVEVWFQRIEARPAVRKAIEVGDEVRRIDAVLASDPAAEAQRSVLFGRRAR